MKNRTELTKSLHTVSVVKALALADYAAAGPGRSALPAAHYVDAALCLLGLTSQANGPTYTDCVTAVTKALAKVQA